MFGEAEHVGVLGAAAAFIGRELAVWVGLSLEPLEELLAGGAGTGSSVVGAAQRDFSHDPLVDVLSCYGTSPLRMLRGVIVSSFVSIEGLKLPDLADRHVLAAAIKAGAQVIVTSNLKHFPAADLRQWDIEAKSPDDFMLDQICIDGRTVAACVQQIADSRTRPPQDIEDVLGQLERDGLIESIAALRAG
ncbi:MAG TPA: hypothetical protein VGY58_10035 [Gemmataceae bacterium]|nr:hypothetical protein [Gemmataceae bacterium]